MSHIVLKFGTIEVAIKDDKLVLTEINQLALSTLMVLIPIGERLNEKQLQLEKECSDHDDEEIDEVANNMLKAKEKEVNMFA